MNLDLQLGIPLNGHQLDQTYRGAKKRIVNTDTAMPSCAYVGASYEKRPLKLWYVEIMPAQRPRLMTEKRSTTAVTMMRTTQRNPIFECRTCGATGLPLKTERKLTP